MEEKPINLEANDVQRNDDEEQHERRRKNKKISDIDDGGDV